MDSHVSAAVFSILLIDCNGEHGEIDIISNGRLNTAYTSQKHFSNHMAMMAWENAFDPLSINLAKQKRVLCALLPPDSFHIQRITEANTPTQTLSTLSHLLAVPALTLTIADLFRPLLIDLCARWLHDDDDIEDRFIAFCLLIELHEELYPCGLLLHMCCSSYIWF
jgi:hypothetical protein